MAYSDEEILKIKKQIEANKAREEAASETEITPELEFERRIIEDLEVSVNMPKQFILLDEELKRLIYPGASAPKYVYGGEGIKFQLTFNKTEHIVPDSGIKEFVKLSAQMLEAVGPKVRIIEKKTIEKEGYNIGVMSFVSRAIDMMVFNYQYYVSVDDKLLIGGISFPSKLKKEYMPIAEEIIDSFEIITK